MYDIPIIITMDCQDVPQAQHGEVYIPANAEIPFGERVYQAAKAISSKYIVVMCDDFIVEREINLPELQEIVRCMETDPLISSVSLESINGKSIKRFLNPHIFGEKYIQRSQFGNYKTTLQCAVWNKTAFAGLMKSIHTPWEFELFSNQKTFPCKNKFYALNHGYERPIEYNRGRFVIRGKVVLPEKERLERVLKTKIQVEGFDYTDSYEQVDAGFFFKIKRRLRLLMGGLMYRLKYFFTEENLNGEDK